MFFQLTIQFIIDDILIQSNINELSFLIVSHTLNYYIEKTVDNGET